MVNIFRSLGYSAIGIAALAWISVILITASLTGPNPDGALVEYFANNIISEENIENSGFTFSELSEDLFLLVGHMNITLLSFCIFMTLLWSAGSHYLNIDAPGKAKIYAIHWVIFTSIYVVVVFGIIYWFTQTTLYAAADQIGGPGSFRIFLFGVIYYSLIYYIGILLGTARFARSSVLFANKLPGNL
jgi:hypothetical protein